MSLTPEFAAPALSAKEIYDRQRALADNAGPTAFKLSAQLLDQGRTDTPLCATEGMTARLKVYASGGENELHAHPAEDHSFIVLQGSARFHGKDGELAHLGPHEGIMLPRGTLYSFLATSDEPLVLLRIGTPNGDKQGKENRTSRTGGYMAGDSKENKSVAVKFRDGAFFA